MAKSSGLTTSVTVAGNNISNDVISIDVDTPYGVQDITGLDKSAVERLTLLADCTGTMTGVFNTTASMSHATLKTPGSKTFVVVYPGTATLTFTAITTGYSLTRAQDGSLVWTVPFQLSSGTAAAWT
jgi:hypothetical protein